MVFFIGAADRTCRFARRPAKMPHGAFYFAYILPHVIKFVLAKKLLPQFAPPSNPVIM